MPFQTARSRHLKNVIKKRVPAPWLTQYQVYTHYPSDPLVVLKFILKGWASYAGADQAWHLKRRLWLAIRLYTISFGVDCPHSQKQMLQVWQAILSAPPGVVVEAGCFKGGSTAKLSLAAAISNRALIAMDSFAGIPDNVELHERDIFGRNVKGSFEAGSYCGSLEEVKSNVNKFGRLDVCRFVPGWFQDTMPQLADPIAVAYIDVDLVSSTKTCLKYLYPLLIPGGTLFSQDGHLPLIVQALDDDTFWQQEIGCAKPVMEGLGISGMIKIIKKA